MPHARPVILSVELQLRQCQFFPCLQGYAAYGDAVQGSITNALPSSVAVAVSFVSDSSFRIFEAVSGVANSLLSRLAVFSSDSILPSL